MIREDLYFATIMLTISTLPTNPDILFYVGVLMAGSLGVILRIGIQLRNKTFSWWGFLVQLLITVPVCYFAYNVWLQYKLTFQLQTYLFLVSFMSLYIATIIDNVSKLGLNEVAQSLLKKIMSLNKEEEIDK